MSFHKSLGVIGHVDYSRSAMTAAILRLMSTSPPAEIIDTKTNTALELKEAVEKHSRGIRYFHVKEEVPSTIETYWRSEWPKQRNPHRNSKWLTPPAKKAHKRRISKRSRKINRH